MRGGRQDRNERPDPDDILETLADEDCRHLVRAMDAPRNASELAERSDVPLSTTYRKLERLEESTLVDTLIEIRDDGRHTSRYHPDFDRIVLTLTEDRELELEISRPARSADERLELLWSEVRKGA